METSGAKFELIYNIVSSDDNLLSVRQLCEIAGVSRSGYYNWVASEDTRKAREEADRASFELVLKAFQHRGYDKGARGIYMQLLHMDPPVIMNIKKIRRIMKKYSLKCPIRKANPYRRIARDLRTDSVAENLLNREFEVRGPRKVMLTDISYLPYNQTFAYLSIITDACTKEALAYSVSDSLEIDFVLNTVDRLIRDHGISLDAETLIHSDQGAHYTSKRFRQLISDVGLRQSMSRKGNCWDNAPQESFFGHMKDEIGERISMCTEFEQVQTIIDDWIDYYNNERYQWNLARLSPIEYYQYRKTGIYPLKTIQHEERQDLLFLSPKCP